MPSLFRRHRVWPWAAGAGAVAVLGALTGVLLAGDGRDAGLRSVDPTPSPTPTSSPTDSPTPAATSASPSPSPSAVPTPTPTPSPTPSPSRTPSPTPSPTPAGPPGDRPDGLPGWDAGRAACRQAGAPGTSLAPYPGLSVELVLPTNSFRTGEPVTGLVRVINSTAATLGFRSYDAGDDGTLLRDGRDPVSAMYSGPRATVQWEVPPGESQERPVTIQAERCGDTSRDPAPALPTDPAYSAVVTLVWERPGGTGRWTTAPHGVTLYR